MVVAQLFGIADTDLARLGGDPPLRADRRLVLSGSDETDPETPAPRHRCHPRPGG